LVNNFIYFKSNKLAINHSETPKGPHPELPKKAILTSPKGRQPVIVWFDNFIYFKSNKLAINHSETPKGPHPELPKKAILTSPKGR